MDLQSYRSDRAYKLKSPVPLEEGIRMMIATERRNPKTVINPRLLRTHVMFPIIYLCTTVIVTDDRVIFA